MAGSPGAGKTEYSKSLLAYLIKNTSDRPIRIDSDELRGEIPGYTGENSSEMQGAVSILLSEMYDRALKNRQTAIIDGTLSHYGKAKENIERSLKRNRQVLIFYIYQHPEVAWQFTVAREHIEGRNIPKRAFIEKFLGSKATVNQIYREFSDRITLFLARKNFQTHAIETVEIVSPQHSGLDAYLPETYTEEELAKLL